MLQPLHEGSEVSSSCHWDFQLNHLFLAQNPQQSTSSKKQWEQNSPKYQNQIICEVYNSNFSCYQQYLKQNGHQLEQLQ